MRAYSERTSATWSPEVLGSFAASFDPKLAALLGGQVDVPDPLRAAMVYSVLAPGKRMRPYLVTRCCEVCGGSAEDAFAPAAAIECVHAFSLVHDDLPAMDDDDLRRGRPTTHKQFDEATAILAGDALLALAFESLASCSGSKADVARMVCVLAAATGATGMIGGQMADIVGQDRPSSIEQTRYIHERKTGRLFESAATLGALAVGAEESAIDAMRRFGLHLGLAFQIADDLLDVTASSQQMGKATSKDACAGKQTYPTCVGIQESHKAAKAAVDEAIGALSPFESAADDLRSLAEYAVSRGS